MKLGHGVFIMVLFSIMLCGDADPDPQRSIVERIKALDKGLRQGWQRKSESSSESIAIAQRQQQVQPVADEKSPSASQQSLSPEDTDGTSAVVRQLTASYEQDNEVSFLSLSTP